MYSIRKCTKEDLDQILTLSENWANEGITIGYENVKHTKSKLENRLNNYFYIALYGNEEVVGYTFGDIRKGNAGPVISEDEEYLEIFEVYIKPDHRKKGIGKKLIEHILKAAESNNIKRSLVGSSNQAWNKTAEFLFTARLSGGEQTVFRH